MSWYIINPSFFVLTVTEGSFQCVQRFRPGAHGKGGPLHHSFQKHITVKHAINSGRLIILWVNLQFESGKIAGHQ
jgi:hypothetical protein